uniref:Homing endonuclease LAGLIDADG domain-containing protein n=1 Tax=Ankistrodesmus falcatus TaxID=52960 RepID=A0A7L7K6F5_9CHLO|nr:hypothetical protein [Ankistrodesmus falcatus]QMS48904.1 hypothetical protein [Ankistrodesmus falcatus]
MWFLHNGPFLQVVEVLQWAVSWNMSMFFYKYTYCSTSFVSSFYNSMLVTMNSSYMNQQVTNVVQIIQWSFIFILKTPHHYHLNTPVGTPEAVCPPTKIHIKKTQNQEWYQWLAGLIDGDGCFLVSKAGYASLEITVESKDEALLYQIKNIYGGSLKPRAGINAVRYRLHHKEGVHQLCLDVNGYIRHPVRFVQFTQVCNTLFLEVKTPDCLHANHGWFAGMFDADGTVRLNLTTPYPQIAVSVTQKYKEVPEAYKLVFGGSLYYDKSQNGYWTWAVQSKSDVVTMLEYFKAFPSRSHKRQKLFLIPEIYHLLMQQAHLPQESQKHPSALYKKWVSLVESWKAF